MAYLVGPTHTLTDFQVEYAGLVMGPDTPYDLPPVWDLLDMAAVKLMDVARVWGDGSFTGPDFADVLVSTVGVDIYASDPASFAAAVLSFMGAVTAQVSDRPLWFKLPSMDPMGIGAKVNTRKLPVDLSWGQLSSAVVEFRITNPQWQSIPRTVTLSASTAASSGLVFPMFNVASGVYAVPGVADFGSTVVSSSGAVLTNAGNAPAWPVVAVSGPTTQPFTVTVDGNTVTYSGLLGAGDVLTIDYVAGIASLQSDIDRTYLLTSREFSAVPAEGSSFIYFSSVSGSCLVTVADVRR